MLVLNKDNPNTAVLMRRVCWALLPAIGVFAWQFGPGIVANLILASFFALLSEALLLYLRRVPPKPFLRDNSALLCAWLIALALPPCLPWWVTALAVSTAIVVAKQLYGGLGNNVFNPAMVGYALAIVAFPLELTDWRVPDYTSWFDLQTCWQCLGGQNALLLQSGATPLTSWRFDLPGVAANEALWLYPNLAFLAGGLWLLYQRVIQWYIPVGFLAAMGISSSVLTFVDASYQTPLFHWFNGTTMIGAFFISTDPVTAPRAKMTRLLFGAGIGLLLVLFRCFSTTVDGLAFAILLMNMLTPLMNRWSSRP